MVSALHRRLIARVGILAILGSVAALLYAGGTSYAIPALLVLVAGGAALAFLLDRLEGNGTSPEDAARNRTQRENRDEQESRSEQHAGRGDKPL